MSGVSRTPIAEAIEAIASSLCDSVVAGDASMELMADIYVLDQLTLRVREIELALTVPARRVNPLRRWLRRITRRAAF